MGGSHRPAPETGSRDPVMVVTGAAGNLGAKLCAYLRDRGGYELRLIDIDARGDADIREADLSRYEEHWTALFDGADIVVQLAAEHRPWADWHSLTGRNVDALLNVYLAAARHKVGKVVLASSLWAVAAQWRNPSAILVGEPDPGTNAYGASKLFAERVARAFASANGMATIALRIGCCLPGKNQPTRLYAPDNEIWLSNRDMCRGVEAAIHSDVQGFAVVNLISANPSQRWSLAEARELIGYVPLDRYVALRSRFSVRPRDWLRGTHLQDRLRSVWRAWRQPH